MVKDDTYVVIQSFMVNELKLKGNELVVYAVIYGFTQDGEHWYYGTRGHLAEWCGASKGTVSNCLRSLVGKGLVRVREVERQGRMERHYQVVRNCTSVSKTNTPPDKSCNTPIPEIDTGNNKERTNKEREGAPTFEEVEKFMLAKGATSTYAEKFYSHYRSQGWRKGNGMAIADWKTIALSWLKEDGIRPKKTYPPSIRCPLCGGESLKTNMYKSGTSIPYYRCSSCGDTRECP